MNEQEIIDAYNILSQNVKDQAARDATIIGNSQRSLGPLAARVASPTGQTSGLANYTYNRLMRPVVDSTAAALTTQGAGQALSKNLADALRAARGAYEDAQNSYTVASTTPNTSGIAGLINLLDSTLGGQNQPADELISPDPPAGTILGIAYRDAGLGRGGVPVYDITIADGKGGVTTIISQGNSQEEALANYRRKNPSAITGSEWLNGASSGGSFSGGGFSGR